MWGTWVAQSVEHLTSAQVMILPARRRDTAGGAVRTPCSRTPDVAKREPAATTTEPASGSLRGCTGGFSEQGAKTFDFRMRIALKNSEAEEGVLGPSVLFARE